LELGVLLYLIRIFNDLGISTHGRYHFTLLLEGI
jgi:hypothetical protein